MALSVFKSRNKIQRKNLNCKVLDTTGRSCPFSTSVHNQMQIHLELNHFCSDCGNIFFDLESHICPQYGRGLPVFDGDGEIDESTFKISQIAHKGSLAVYTYEVENNSCIVADVFEEKYEAIYNFLKSAINYYNGIRISIKILCDLVELQFDISRENTPTSSPFYILLHESFIKEVVVEAVSFIIESLNVMIDRGSEWSVKKINSIQLHIGVYTPATGRSYIETPKELKRKYGIINIKTDNCFELSVLCSVYGDEIFNLFIKNDSRYENSSKKYLKEVKRKFLSNESSYSNLVTNKTLNFDSIIRNCKKGVGLLDIDIFERNNSQISINVFTLKKGNIVPIRVTKHKKVHHVTLILINKDNTSHYIYAKNCENFWKKRNRDKSESCPTCLKRYFVKNKSLSKHRCGTNLKTLITNPKGLFYEFKNLHMLLKIPYCLYYKFQYMETKEYIEGKGFINSINPVSYVICLVYNSNIIKIKTYTGADSVKHFLKSAVYLAKECIFKMKTRNVPIIITEEEKMKHFNLEKCELCDEPFTTLDNRTMHHDHDSGRYISTIHNSENIQIKYKLVLNAISFGAPYELKLLINSALKDLKLRVHPISNKSGEILGVFIDRILKINRIQNFRDGATLDELRSEIIKDNYDLIFYKNFLSTNGNMEFYDDLLKKKIPELVYDSSINYLSLHPTPLNLIQIQQERLFQKFGSNLNSYTKFLNIVNCIIEVEIFENHRNVSFNEYKLEVLNCWTMGSYSIKAAFFYNRLKIEYIKCSEMNTMIDKGIVGGITGINSRVEIANSERIGNFDPTKPRTEILFSDLSSNYSSVMLGFLPCSNHKWMSENEIKEFNFYSPRENSGMGYIFTVSLEVPLELHDKLSQLPFPPEKKTLELQLLSDNQTEYLKNDKSGKNKHEYLLLTLFNKENIVLYYKMIAFALRLGLRLTSVKNGISFTEKEIFKDFVHENLKKRAQAETEVKKTYIKLLLNMLAGKTLQDSSSYKQSKFCATKTEAKLNLAKNNFNSFEIIGKDVSLFKFDKNKACDKNIRIVGLCILSNAKLILYNYIYNYIYPTFGKENVKILYYHTDSFMALINDEDKSYLKKLKSLDIIYDFSSLSSSHELYNMKNKGKAGVFKIVCDLIIEFYAISPSQYSIKTIENERGVIKCGGIEKGFAQKNFKHENFKNIIEKNSFSEKGEMPIVRFFDDKIIKFVRERKMLGGICLKRHFLSDNHSLPFGHYKLKNSN